MTQSNNFVYASLGNQLDVFGLNLNSGKLYPVQSLSFDEVVQYACANQKRTILYVVTSGSGPMATHKVLNHFVQAFQIQPDGTLRQLQDPVRLGNRPLFVSLDPQEKHLLLAYNNPSDVTVHKRDPDGKIGGQVLQNPLYFGPTVHQVRVTPQGNIAVVPASAHSANGILAGCVDFFDYDNGRLSPRSRITADPSRIANWRGVKNGALGFSARHVEFHPTHPWMYLVVETQGELHLYDCDKTGVSLVPRAIKSTLSGAPVGRSFQLAGAIHIHPNGRFIYVSNRAWEKGPDDPVVKGANTIAVFEIDQNNGAPQIIQQIETKGIFPRTFGIDAAGKMLVVGNQEPGKIQTSGTVRQVVPSLVSFKIGDDGKLTFVRHHDHPDNGKPCFWSTVLTLN